MVGAALGIVSSLRSSWHIDRCRFRGMLGAGTDCCGVAAGVLTACKMAAAGFKGVFESVSEAWTAEVPHWLKQYWQLLSLSGHGRAACVGKGASLSVREATRNQ